MRRLIAGLAVAALTTTMAFAEASRWKSDWPNTDFTKMSVNAFEIFSGGPPKDGIPAITDPTMKAVADEDEIAEREPVMSVALDGQTPRAYPIRYLMWHEIVNDRIGDTPVAVTFCPLCNSGLAFDLRLDGQELELGVSGMLRHSDMIMYDRQTESWWQQFTGEAIVGKLLGEKLTPLPALLESWGAFKARHPDGLVMAEPTNHSRRYGSNPYRGYDSGTPFLYRGENPPHDIHPLTRVIRVGDKAWPMIRVREAGSLKEAGLILTWEEGQASALDDGTIAEGREVGNVVVTTADGAPVVFEVVFAFAFHAFTPDGDWMLGEI